MLLNNVLYVDTARAPRITFMLLYGQRVVVLLCLAAASVRLTLHGGHSSMLRLDNFSSNNLVLFVRRAGDPVPYGFLEAGD